MTVALTYAEVEALDPQPVHLSRAVELLGGKWTTPIDAETARRRGICLSDIVCILSRLAKREPDVARCLRLWAADCAARVLPIYESRYPADHRPRDAIIATRQYARGEIARHLLPLIWRTRQYVWMELWARTADAAAAAAANAAYYSIVTYYAADAAYFAGAAMGDTVNAERAWQFERLCAWLSDNEPDDWPLMDREAA